MGHTDELPEWADAAMFQQYLWEHYGYKSLSDDDDLAVVHRAMRVQQAISRRPVKHA